MGEKAKKYAIITLGENHKDVEILGTLISSRRDLWGSGIATFFVFLLNVYNMYFKDYGLKPKET